jgi:protein-S-isoprenylcysteine O-methyltransferase Ste14
LGLFNGWLLLAAYGAGLLLSVTTFSPAEKARLFTDPKTQLHGVKKWLRSAGQVVAVAYITLMLFVPLKVDTPWGVVGLGLFILGLVTVMVSLQVFKQAPQDQPVTAGPYRLSRNPQWLGLFLVFLGSALLSGAWLPLGMVLAIAAVYHIQILEEEKLCLAMYGDSYRAYTARVSRYLLFF